MPNNSLAHINQERVLPSRYGQFVVYELLVVINLLILLSRHFKNSAVRVKDFCSVTLWLHFVGKVERSTLEGGGAGERRVAPGNQGISCKAV